MSYNAKDALNKLKAEDNPLHVSKETMQGFIDSFPNFCLGVEVWLTERAMQGDVQSMNHFIAFCKSLYEGTLKMLDDKLRSDEMKNFNAGDTTH